jgi:hypothetical protein
VSDVALGPLVYSYGDVCDVGEEFESLDLYSVLRIFEGGVNLIVTYLL